MKRGVRVAIAVAAVGVLATGCRTVTGTAQAGEPSVDSFEGKTGDFSIVPPTVDDPRTEEQGIIMESMRLGNVAIAPTDADPTLDDNWLHTTGPVVSPAEATGEGYFGHYFFADVARPVLEQYGMLGGYAVTGGDIPLTSEGDAPAGATAITMTILRFPSEDAARNAAREIDAADFARGGPENEKVDIPGYPEANSHWRPNFPSLAATTAHGEFVVDVFAFRPAPDKASLTALVRKVYDAQFPKLDAFEATPADAIADLPTDPDGLFVRSLTTYSDLEVDGRTTWLYDLAGLTHVAPKEDLERLREPFADAGVTAIAAADESSVVRARDAESADKLVKDLAGGDDRKATDAPDEIAEYTTCYERTDPSPDESRFGCYVRYRDYVAGITSDDVDDLGEKAIAQFAVLVNSEMR